MNSNSRPSTRTGQKSEKRHIFRTFPHADCRKCGAFWFIKRLSHFFHPQQPTSWKQITVQIQIASKNTPVNGTHPFFIPKFRCFTTVHSSSRWHWFLEASPVSLCSLIETSTWISNTPSSQHNRVDVLIFHWFVTSQTAKRNPRVKKIESKTRIVTDTPFPFRQSWIFIADYLKGYKAWKQQDYAKQD